MPRVVDLSQEIYQGMPVYAGHLKTVVWQHHSHEETGPLFESEFSYQSLGLMLCDHGPTHVDAISHLDPREGAPTIDQMSLDTFWGSGTCLDISDVPAREYCDAERLDRALAESGAELREGDVLLLRPGAARRHARVHLSVPRARPERRELAGGPQAQGLRRRLSQPGQPGRPDLSRPSVLPADGHHPLRDPRQPRRGGGPPVHLLRVPAARARGPRLAGPRGRDAR